MRNLMMLVTTICVLMVTGFIGGDNADACGRLRCRTASRCCRPACRPRLLRGCRRARRCCEPVSCCRSARTCCASTSCRGDGCSVGCGGSACCGDVVADGAVIEGESGVVESPSDAPVEAPPADVVPEAPVEEGAAAEGDSA